MNIPPALVVPTWNSDDEDDEFGYGTSHTTGRNVAGSGQRDEISGRAPPAAGGTGTCTASETEKRASQHQQRHQTESENEQQQQPPLLQHQVSTASTVTTLPMSSGNAVNPLLDNATADQLAAVDEEEDLLLLGDEGDISLLPAEDEEDDVMLCGDGGDGGGASSRSFVTDSGMLGRLPTNMDDDDEEGSSFELPDDQPLQQHGGGGGGGGGGPSTTFGAHVPAEFLQQRQQANNNASPSLNKRQVSFAFHIDADLEDDTPPPPAAGGEEEERFQDDIDNAASSSNNTGGGGGAAFPQPSDKKKPRSRFGRWYHAGSFQLMVSYVLHYYSNVLSDNEIEEIYTLNTATGVQPLELLLRLGSRKPLWFGTNKLRVSYGEKIDIDEAVKALALQPSASSQPNRTNSSQSQHGREAPENGTAPLVPPHPLIRSLDSSQVLLLMEAYYHGEQQPANSNAINVQDVTKILTVGELREIAEGIRDSTHSIEIAAKRQEMIAANKAGGSLAAAAAPAETLPQEEEEPKKGKKKGKKKRQQGDDAPLGTRLLTEGELQRRYPPPLLPTGKDSLWNYIYGKCFINDTADGTATLLEELNIGRDGDDVDAFQNDDEAMNNNEELSVEQQMARKQMVMVIRQAKAARATFRHLWTDIIGDAVVSIVPNTKKTLALVLKLFHLISGFMPSSGSSSATGSEPPLPRNDIILSTLGVVTFPAIELNGMALSPLRDLALAAQQQLNRSSSSSPFQAFSFASDGVTQKRYLTKVPKLHIFKNRELLDSYLDALAIDVELFEALEGSFARKEQRDKVRSAKAVSDLDARVVKGLKHLAEASGRARLADRVGGKRKRNAAAAADDASDGFLSIPDILAEEKDILRYPHLLRFLPIYRWLGIVERLYELHEYNKNYTRAMLWLRVLLHTNVHPDGQYPMIPPGAVEDPTLPKVPTDGYPKIPYRYNKRGEWEYRIILDDQKRKQIDRSLERAERIHRMYTDHDQLAAAKAADVKSAMKAWLRTPAARGSRVHHWSDVDIDSHAIQFVECEEFCRRAHRLAIERTLNKMSHPPRRWKGIPQGELGQALLHPEETFVHAKKEQGKGGCWIETHRSSVPQRPEDYVLRWNINGRGRKEDGWGGCHCEGSWASSFFAILLHDIIYDDLQINDGQSYAWFTPFQSSPLDFYHPSFWQRNQMRIEATLDHFASCTRSEFLQHCRRVLGDVGIEVEDVGSTNTNTGGGGDSTTNATAAGGGGVAAAVDPNDNDAVPTTDQQQQQQAGEEGAEDPQFFVLPTQLQVAVGLDEEQEQDKDGDAASPKQHWAAKRKKESDEVGAAAASDQVKKFSTTASMISTSLPLYNIAECIPQGPLCKMLRALGGSALKEGHMIRFSGFPDLVLYRTRTISKKGAPPPGASAGQSPTSATVPPPPSAPGRTLCRRFILCEVKSPNDQISEKQLEKCDLLMRCGFEVELTHIVDVAAPKATRLMKEKTSTFNRMKAPPLTRKRSKALEGLNAISATIIDDDDDDDVDA